MFNNISKRILIVFLILVCFLAAGANFSAFATTMQELEIQTYGDYQYTVLEDSSAEITKYIGEATILEIPAEINGHAVSSIGDEAFYYCLNLTKIALPDSVTSIGDSAFALCFNLTEITIPNSVTSIGNYAFAGCYFTEITIPDSVTSIGDEVFSSCMRITEITIPDSVISVGTNPFSRSTIESIRVSPDHPYLATIDGLLFSKPDKRLICCPNIFTAKTCSIPEGILSIGDSAFYGCVNLTQVTIPDSVTSIGNEAFYCCESLKEITIPDSVTSVGTNPFSYSDIESIYISPDHPYLVTIDGVLFSKPDKRLICYPSIFSDTSYSIPNGMLAVGDFAFYCCENLTQITIPDSVTSIGNEAFYCCENLTQITIPDSVTSIGNEAFYYCANLKEIAIPDSVTSIGKGAFTYCPKLTDITIPDSVTFIGDDAFANCENLKNIIVVRDSYAAEYCRQNNLPYIYTDAND